MSRFRAGSSASAPAYRWIPISSISAATMKPTALVDRLHFRPNLELGIGDDLVTTALNFEFVYKFPSRSGWRLYAGGGPPSTSTPSMTMRLATTTPRPSLA